MMPGISALARTELLMSRNIREPLWHKAGHDGELGVGRDRPSLASASNSMSSVMTRTSRPVAPATCGIRQQTVPDRYVIDHERGARLGLEGGCGEQRQQSPRGEPKISGFSSVMRKSPSGRRAQGTRCEERLSNPSGLSGVAVSGRYNNVGSLRRRVQYWTGSAPSQAVHGGVRQPDLAAAGEEARQWQSRRSRVGDLGALGSAAAARQGHGRPSACRAVTPPPAERQVLPPPLSQTDGERAVRPLRGAAPARAANSNRTAAAPIQPRLRYTMPHASPLGPGADLAAGPVERARDLDAGRRRVRRRDRPVPADSAGKRGRVLVHRS